MMRRFGDTPVAAQRYIQRPGAYAILAREGQILLTYQAAPFFEYQLPGGGIDAGESAIQALHREVFEETGWRIATPKKLGAYRRFVYMPEYEIWAEKMCHIYLARPVLRLGDAIEEDHTALWATPDIAEEILCNEGDRAFLSKLLA